jgi:competence protein CoiA
MKFALVNGQRQEARPSLSGVCQVCDEPVFSRCGDVRLPHWAHHKRSNCDHWWEPETAWHRKWKEHFPVNWQEIVQLAENGEKHIADVKTDQGWVIEFQHSYIKPDERRSREDFYHKLIWVVDGTRRKRDKSQFFKALQYGRLILKELGLWRFPIREECALLRDWTRSNVPVFFDFSGCANPEDAQLSLIDLTKEKKLDDDRLWCLIQVFKGEAYGGWFSRETFVKFHNPDENEKDLDFTGFLKKINEAIEVISGQYQPPPPRRSESLQQYLKRIN